MFGLHSVILHHIFCIVSRMNVKSLYDTYWCLLTNTLHCQKYWHPLLMTGLNTLVISMSTNLNDSVSVYKTRVKEK